MALLHYQCQKMYPPHSFLLCFHPRDSSVSSTAKLFLVHVLQQPLKQISRNKGTGWNLISLIFRVAENSPFPLIPVRDQNFKYETIGSYLESIYHRYRYFYSFYPMSSGLGRWIIKSTFSVTFCLCITDLFWWFIILVTMTPSRK